MSAKAALLPHRASLAASSGVYQHKYNSSLPEVQRSGPARRVCKRAVLKITTTIKLSHRRFTCLIHFSVKGGEYESGS